jgi:hypothetical protein
MKSNPELGKFPEPKTAPDLTPWQPAASEPARAGAMDAYLIPSLGDDVRKRPIIISSTPRESVGVHGWRAP